MDASIRLLNESYPKASPRNSPKSGRRRAFAKKGDKVFKLEEAGTDSDEEEVESYEERAFVANLKAKDSIKKEGNFHLRNAIFNVLRKNI